MVEQASDKINMLGQHFSPQSTIRNVSGHGVGRARPRPTGPAPPAELRLRRSSLMALDTGAMTRRAPNGEQDRSIKGYNGAV
jgi:hypothetical protein